MKKHLLFKSLLLLCALIVGTNAWADTSTVTASKIASSSASWTGSAKETWSVTVEGGATNQNVTNGYAQVGTKSSPSTSITFSTSGISGTITNIVVDCASYSGHGTISATVGGSAFGTQSQSIPSWSSSTGGDITFSGSASGAIDITMTNSSGGRAMYIKSITVTYTPSGGGSDPSISVNSYSVNADEEGENGTINITYTNIASVDSEVKFYASNGTDEATYDWLTAAINNTDNTKLDYTINANTGAARTAYMKVHQKNSDVYSGLITITQAKKSVAYPAFNLNTGRYFLGTEITLTSAGNTIYYNMTTDGTTPSDPTNASTEYTAPIVLSSGTTKIKAIAYDAYGNISTITDRTYTGVEPATLPFTFDKKKADIETTTGLIHSGLASDYSSSPYLKFDSADDYVILHFDGVPGTLTFDIKGNGSGSDPWAGTFTVQTSADGETYSDLKVYTSLGSKTNEKFILGSSVRYIKWIYTTKSIGNVALGNINFSAYSSTISITSAKEYTTLTCPYALNFTEVTGLKAFIATEISEGKVQMTQVKKVPAGTGLVLKATTPGSAVNVPVFDGTGADNVSGNKMDGSATETTAVAANGGYILSDGVFHPALEGTLAAGKAYLNIAVVAGARALEMNFDDNETTAVNEITNTNLTNNTNEFFDLQGRKVAQPTKGLYIVNGKKVIIK